MCSLLAVGEQGLHIFALCCGALHPFCDKLLNGAWAEDGISLLPELSQEIQGICGHIELDTMLS